VKVLRIERACDCIIKYDNPVELVLEPGQTFQVSAQIRLPRWGIQSGTLYVVHDGKDSPLRLTVEASGRQAPPYLFNESSHQVAFFALDTPTAAEKLFVKTCEAAEGKSWLGRMTCDLPEAAVECIGIKEDRSDTLIVRIYEFRIGWKRLPLGREFDGKLRVATNYGSPAEIELGAVVGTRLIPDNLLKAE
jgi:hypothetical protein